MSDPTTPPAADPNPPADAGEQGPDPRVAEMEAELARLRAAEAKRAREAQVADAAKRDKMEKDERVAADLESTRKELADLKAANEAREKAAAEAASKAAAKIRKALPKSHPVHMMSDENAVKWHSVHGQAAATTTGTKHAPADAGPPDYSSMSAGDIGIAFAKAMNELAAKNQTRPTRRAVRTANPTLWEAYMNSRSAQS